ncbi:MAG: hypothetical protein JNK82_02860 [Myxococcaceae bacterium]|nr:hypothetical protein [Myxococcaceae bacterium]
MWLAVTALWLTAAPASMAVRLELQPNVRCLGEPGLREALRARGVLTARATVSLVAEPDGEGVRVRLLDEKREVLASRRLPIDAGPCGALAQTVAALARSWLDELGVKVAPRPPPPTPRPTDSVRPVEPVLEPVVEEPAPPPPPAPVAPAPVAPVPEPEAGPAPTAARAPPPLTLPVSSAAPSSSFGARWRRAMGAVVLVGGGLRGGPRDVLVGSGGVTAEWGFFEPFALALDVGFDSDRSGARDPGTASAAIQWGSLLVRGSLFGPKGGGLTVSLGAGVDRISATARGFSVSNNAWVLAPSASARVEWRQPIVAGLQVFVRVGLHSRFRDERFLVDNIAGPVLTVPPLTFEASLGAAWRFF